MKLVDENISVKELKGMAEKGFGDLVKAVVDVEKQIMIVDADLHADEEKKLLSRGSKQQSLWGINLYPELYGTDRFIEFDSMINLRPSQNNMSRGVDDIHTQEKIRKVVSHLVSA